MRLYLGKLQYAVEEVLTERHLATSGPKGDLLLRNEVAQIVFAITAKHVANTALRTEDVRVLPQTDREVSLSHAYGELDPSDRYRCRELLLSGVYPFPGDMVSFEDIVQFRMRYRGELLELRAEIDRLLDNVRNSPEPLDAIQSARQGMQIAVQRVGRAARGRHISFLSSAVTVLATGSAAKAHMAPDTVKWVFDGFGVAGISLVLGSRIVRGPGNKTDPYAYLMQAHKTYG